MKQSSQHVSCQVSLGLLRCSTATVEQVPVDDSADRDGTTAAAVAVERCAVRSSVCVGRVAGDVAVVLDVWAEIAQYGNRVPPSTPRPRC